MSANRIVKRRAWNGTKNGLTYHDHAIKVGDRHASFQRSKRAARVDMGLAPTSSSMHHLHGSRI